MRIIYICGLLFLAFFISGCFTIQKYPGKWPEQKRITSASELSGEYNIKFLDFFGPYMNGFDLKSYDASRYRVRFSINDSLHYTVSLVPKVKGGIDNQEEFLLFRGHGRSEYDKNTNTSFRSKTKKTKKGIRFSHNPTYGKQHSILAFPFAEKKYLVLDKDSKGNLIVKNGQRGYYLCFFVVPIIFEEYEWISIGSDTTQYSRKRIKQRF